MNRRKAIAAEAPYPQWPITTIGAMRPEGGATCSPAGMPEAIVARLKQQVTRETGIRAE